MDEHVSSIIHGGERKKRQGKDTGKGGQVIKRGDGKGRGSSITKERE